MAVRILVPLDGSERSLDAMEKGLLMLQESTKEVTLFVVQHEGFHGAPDDVVEGFDDDEDDEIFPTRESAQRVLDAAAQRLAHQGIKAKTQVVEGKVQKAIIEEAANHDLVLMHALNKSGFLEKLKMSGTESIARKVPCSVMLVAD